MPLTSFKCIVVGEGIEARNIASMIAKKLCSDVTIVDFIDAKKISSIDDQNQCIVVTRDKDTLLLSDEVVLSHLLNLSTKDDVSILFTESVPRDLGALSNLANNLAETKKNNLSLDISSMANDKPFWCKKGLSKKQRRNHR